MLTNCFDLVIDFLNVHKYLFDFAELQQSPIYYILWKNTQKMILLYIGDFGIFQVGLHLYFTNYIMHKKYFKKNYWFKSLLKICNSHFWKNKIAKLLIKYFKKDFVNINSI